MISPSPTSKIDPKHVRGVLAGVVEGAGDEPDTVRITVPNSSYDLHLVLDGPLNTKVGKRIIGTIRACALRMDVVETGGRYVEPVHGRPRRVQGVVVEVHEGAVVVNAGVPIHCVPTDRRQCVDDFESGQFVSFDVARGATFTESA